MYQKTIDYPPPTSFRDSTMIDREPDAFEKCVRFGCGFMLGAITTFFLALREVDPAGQSLFAAAVGVGILFGLFAVRYGDKFWQVILGLLTWW